MTRAPTLLVATSAALALWGSAAYASPPTMQLTGGSGVAAWRAGACGCVDRFSWEATAGLRATWGEGVGLEAGGRYGGIVIPWSGYFSTTGWYMGARSGALLDLGRATVELRGGTERLKAAAAREATQGIYLAPVLVIPLSPALRLEQELTSSLHFGSMAHITTGLRGGLTWAPGGGAPYLPSRQR